MPTTTRTVTATKSCTTTFKEKICLATWWQATQSWPLQLLEALIWTPLCLLLWLVLGSLSRKWQALKNTRKKKQKANFVRVEYKKIPDAIQSYLRGEYYNEKDFLDRLKIVDNFITDHCMETPAKTRDGKPQNRPYGAGTLKFTAIKLSLNVSTTPLPSSCSATSTHWNATPWGMAVCCIGEKASQHSSALNNQITWLTGKLPAVAIKENTVVAERSTPYFRSVGVNEKTHKWC